MNAAPHLDYSRLPQAAQDLRPQYEAAVGDALRLVWRRRLLIATVAICTVAAALGVAKLMSRTYVGEALVQLKFGGDAAAPPAAGLVAVDGVAMVESEAEILRSRAIARRVLDRLEGAARAAAAPSGEAARGDVGADARVVALQSGLTVKTDGKTYLIHVIYAAHDPLRAAMVANVFAEEYLRSRIEVSVAAAQRTGEWLEAQIVGAAAERQRASDAVRAFRARPDAVAAGAGDAQIREQQVRDLVAQVSAAKVEGDRLEGRLERLTDAVEAGRVPSVADLQGSSDVQRLIDAEVTSRQESSRLAEILGTKHPLYARADKAHAVALQQLEAAVAAAAGVARSDLASARDAQTRLAQQLAGLRAAALDAQSLDRALRELEAKDAAAQANLDRLQEAHRQAVALADLKPVAAQLVSAAEPLSIPTSPNMKVVAVLSGIGGLVAGLALVFLLERRDTGFTTEAEAAGDLGVACAGLIPSAESREGAERRARRHALKSLVVGAGLSEPKGACAVVVVTSTISGEGKSELVRGLAEALGELNRRVLVLDDSAVEAEMPDGPDFDGACGPERGSDHALVSVERRREDLAEMLARGEPFGPWMAEARARFDVVLVEAPAILSDAEALMLARSADLVLFAVRWRSTPRRAALAAFRQLLPAPGQQAFVVVTEVDLREHRRLGLRDALYYARRFADAGRAAG